MYSTSNDFDTIVSAGKGIYTITVTRTYDDQILDLDIDNFEYTGAKCVSDSITFGNALCQCVTFSIHNPNINLEGEELFIEQGLMINDSLENVPIGYFVVQKPVSDGEVTTYTCYDRMTKLEQYYKNENQYVNAFDILYDISQITGVTINRPDPTTNYFIDTGAMSNWGDVFTMREVVGFIGGLYGKDAYANRDGEIEFKWYEQINYTIDGNRIYQGQINIESDSNMTIDKLVCKKQLPGYYDEEYEYGTGDNIVYISNPFMNENIIEDTYDAIDGLTFRGLNVEFIGDFRIDLGDIINVVKNSVTYKCLVMEITHECDGGIRTRIICHAQADEDFGSGYVGHSTRNLDRVNNAVSNYGIGISPTRVYLKKNSPDSYAPIATSSDIQYIIQSVHNNASINNPLIYSTSESIVGKWIDGKHVYQRVVEINNVSSGFTTIIDGSTTLIDKLVSISGYVLVGTVDHVLPYYYADSGVTTTYYRLLKGNSGTWNNSVMLHASSSVDKLIAIVQYTKTTD